MNIQPIVHTDAEIRLTQAWADLYRARGYNPLPSRPEAKRPFLRWSEWVDRPVPADLFNKFQTANVQVMCGRRWGLMVIDLDGPEAIEHWRSLCPMKVRTWITHSGGRGRHLWFRVDPDGPPITSGRLWGVWEPEARDGKGDWKKHVAIERLGDRRLIMAPPSIHPDTGRRYRFMGHDSPKGVGRPAWAPGWVMGMQRSSGARWLRCQSGRRWPWNRPRGPPGGVMIVGWSWTLSTTNATPAAS